MTIFGGTSANQKSLVASIWLTSLDDMPCFNDLNRWENSLPTFTKGSHRDRIHMKSMMRVKPGAEADLGCLGLAVWTRGNITWTLRVPNTQLGSSCYKCRSK